MTRAHEPPTARYLDVRGVAKSFRQTTVLEDLDLAMTEGEFVSLLGPSGCGKTTLLRMIAGLLAADHGQIRLAGEDITARPPHRREVGVVFQNYALFPHLSVADNVAFGLKARGADRADIDRTVETFLGLVEMADFRNRSPRALSGGQQQRVAVARALAVRPRILLLDEPFSALDKKLRETMQVELKRLLREQGITAVFVTHDQDEALIMSDRIAVMNDGRIDQIDTPGEIYAHPKTAFVLDFVGRSSTIRGKVAAAQAGEVEVTTALGTIRARGSFMLGADVLIAVRPEQVAIGEVAGDGANRVDVRLEDRIYIGARTMVHCRAADGSAILAELTPDKATALADDTDLCASWPVAATSVLAA